MKLWSSEYQRKEKDTNSGSEKMKSKILSFFDLTAIGVGNSLGIGISVLIGDVIKNVTGPAIVISVFLAGITALIGGLCSAEFGVRFLKTDSVYSYSYFWSIENVAFIYGWALILVYVVGIASAAKGIITFADVLSDYKISDFLKKYTSTGFSDVFPYFDFVSLGLVAIVIVIIAVGVKDSLVVKKLFTVCHLALIASIIISGTFKADTKKWQVVESFEENTKGGFAPFGVLGVIKGAAIAFYGFIGFDTVCASGEEIHKRKRNLPLAILVIVLITLGAYAGVGVILTLMSFYDELNPHAAVPFAFQQAGWISFKWVVITMSFFGFQTSMFGAIFPLPKVIQAMANDGLLFNTFSNCQIKFKTSIIMGGFIAAGLAGIFSFQKLVNWTVIGALCVYTILAINMILLRYSPKLKDDEKLSESWKNLINKNEDVSVKTVMQNYFNFKKKHPTNLTKKIIAGNVVLFCVSSTGISVIFNVFYDSLVKCTTETVISASVLLSIMLCNMVSITCQPKSQEFVPFKVPLIPFVPCLSIFLNIFLMVTFDSLTWILFSSWMGFGIFFQIFCLLSKYIKGEMNKNSLYQINKTNVLKLNESIWKIKSDKKSFYEGAVNPVFSGDTEITSYEVKGFEIQEQYKKISLQLKQAEIIQTAESVAEERTEPLRNELELNFIRINNPEILRAEQEEADEKVYWECVAEIHTEEEGPQESVALDSVENFISEVSTEWLRDDVTFWETAPETISLKEERFDEFSIAGKNDFEETGDKRNDAELLNLQPSSLQVNKQYNKYTDSNYLEKKQSKSFKTELFKKSQLRINNMNYNETELHDLCSSDSKNMEKIVLDENTKKVLNENSSEKKFSKETISRLSHSTLDEINSNKNKYLNFMLHKFYEAHKSEMILTKNNIATTDMPDAKGTKSVPDESGKLKEFKEKLNQILKNQINSHATLNKDPLAQSVSLDDAEKNNKKNNDTVHSSIKTLNKSQIKHELEFLLAKGPPSRPSLETSLNVKIKGINVNKVKELEKIKEEIFNVPSSNISNSSANEENYEKSSVTLPDGVKEKTIFLNEGNKELSSDIYC